MKDRNSRRSRAFLKDGDAFRFYSEKQAEEGYCTKGYCSDPTFCFDGVVCGYCEFENKMFILAKDCKDPELFFAGLLDKDLRFGDKNNDLMFYGNNEEILKLAEQEFPIGSILSISVHKDIGRRSSYAFEVKQPSLSISNKWNGHSFSTSFPQDVTTLLQGLDFSCVFIGHIVEGFVSGLNVDNSFDVVIKDGTMDNAFSIKNKRDRLLCYPQLEDGIAGYEASIYMGCIIIGTYERYFSVITPLSDEKVKSNNKLLMKKIKHKK